jgi:hypothetical protein
MKLVGIKFTYKLTIAPIANCRSTSPYTASKMAALARRSNEIQANSSGAFDRY